jgi:hypothetical protein
MDDDGCGWRPTFRAFRVRVLLEDRRLRPDARTAAAAKRRIKGLRHRMKQGWSLALGSIADLAARDLAAVQQHDRRHRAELHELTTRIELTRQRADRLQSCIRDAEALRAALTA